MEEGEGREGEGGKGGLPLSRSEKFLVEALISTASFGTTIHLKVDFVNSITSGTVLQFPLTTMIPAVTFT